MAQLVTVRLSRGDAQPWGLRLQGGKDFGTPLVVQKVNMGSLADQAGLQVGDAIIKVNAVDAFNLRHKDAQDLIVQSGNGFELTVQRGGGTWRPSVTPTGAVPSPTPNYAGNGYLPTVTKTSLAHKQPEAAPIGTGYNNAARPFGGVQQHQNGADPMKSIVNKQYNTPVGIYSEESIAETLSAQAEVLAGGVLGVNFKKNEKVYNSANSEVLKALQEAESEPAEPERQFTQSPHHPHYNPQQSQQQPPPPQQQQEQPPLNYQQIKQQFQQASPQQQPPHPQQHQPQYPSHHQPQQQNLRAVTPVTKHVTAPVNQAPAKPAAAGLPTGQNICAECERLIVGVFVRIKDKNLHVDCFKCATCGTSLKNQGYFNLNNKLYCDIHAKMAAINNPPVGTEGYRPVPIQPNTKLSASTISAALNAHHANGGPNAQNVNSSLGGPKPFNYGPPAAAPKSPASYPAPAQNAWSQPKPQQQPLQQQFAPAPVANQYNGSAPQPNYGSATLPRPAGQNAPGRYVQPQHQHQPQHHYQAPHNNHHLNRPAQSAPQQYHSNQYQSANQHYGYNNANGGANTYYNKA